MVGGGDKEQNKGRLVSVRSCWRSCCCCCVDVRNILPLTTNSPTPTAHSEVGDRSVSPHCSCSCCSQTVTQAWRPQAQEPGVGWVEAAAQANRRDRGSERDGLQTVLEGVVCLRVCVSDAASLLCAAVLSPTPPQPTCCFCRAATCLSMKALTAPNRPCRSILCC